MIYLSILLAFFICSIFSYNVAYATCMHYGKQWLHPSPSPPPVRLLCSMGIIWHRSCLPVFRRDQLIFLAVLNIGQWSDEEEEETGGGQRGGIERGAGGGGERGGGIQQNTLQRAAA